LRFLDSARNDKAIIERAGNDLLQADEYLARVGVKSDASTTGGIKRQFGEGAEQCTRGRVRSPDDYPARVGVKAMPSAASGVIDGQTTKRSAWGAQTSGLPGSADCRDTSA